MKTKIISILLILALAFNLSVSAMAVEARADSISPSLSFSGTNANCSVTISAIGKNINATLQLWQGSSLIATWPVSGTSYAANGGSVRATSGATYTLKVVGVIGGELIDALPVNGTCP